MICEHGKKVGRAKRPPAPRGSPIRALIVDDEILARQLIRSLLAGDRDITIVGECAGGREAVEAIGTHRPDLVFLDIRMPGLSGFDVLESIEPEQLPYIIFITAYDRYAVKAFEVHALDYILKPFEKERFFKSINRAKEVIRSRGLSKVAHKITQMIGAVPYLRQVKIREGGRLFAVDTADIVWLEAANQYVRIHTLKGSYLLSRSLNTLEKQLDPRMFFRIHRSAIANAAFIKEVRTARNSACSVYLSTGETLKLSRGRRGILTDLLKHCTEP